MSCLIWDKLGRVQRRCCGALPFKSPVPTHVQRGTGVNTLVVRGSGHFRSCFQVLILVIKRAGCEYSEIFCYQTA